MDLCPLCGYKLPNHQHQCSQASVLDVEQARARAARKSAIDQATLSGAFNDPNKLVFHGSGINLSALATRVTSSF